MKQFNYVMTMVVITLLSVVSTSCQNEDAPMPETLNSGDFSECRIHPLNQNQIMDIGIEVGALIAAMPTEPASRSPQALSDYAMQVSATEKSIEKSMQPMVQVGKDLQDASLQMSDIQVKNCEVTLEEIQIIQSLTDEELAGIGFMLSVLCSDNNDVDILHNDALMQSRYIDCLYVALGIDGVIDILQGGGSVGAIISGTKGLINAKTMVKVLKALGLRYLGWLGVGMMIYDYADCVRNGH